MPKARNRWERCRQILAWAKTEFPIPPETELAVAAKIYYRKEECGGLTGRGGPNRSMRIALSSSACPNEFCAVMVLEHEMAHAATYDEGKGILHGPRFHEMHGRIQDAFEHHGISDADTFPTE
jgi:hypothetical protein